MTLVTADDKGRVCIRGTKAGRKYLIKEAENGWWVTPAPEIKPPRPSKRRKEWTGGKKDLAEHLQEMADLGFSFEPSDSGKQKVGPCQF